MIITTEVTIKITEKNLEYYEGFGYQTNIGAMLTIPIGLLKNGSQYKILCKCDECGIEKEVIYKNYIKYGNEWGEYYCRLHSEWKRKKSLNESHGVDYPLQNIKIRQELNKKNKDK